MYWKEIASTKHDDRVFHDAEGWDEYIIIETEKELSEDELRELIEDDFNSHNGCEGRPGQWFMRSHFHQARYLGKSRYVILVHHAIDM